MKILVVDDDSPSRILIATILESAGYQTVSAKDGIEALAIARSDSVDVVITDILMPRMDGFRLTQEWKRDPALSMIPVIFTTASYLDPADERLAVQMGADAFIAKPLDPENLLKLVEAVISEAQAGRISEPLQREDSETLKAYTERIVQKLEHKQIELERSNAVLETAMLELSEQIDAKQHLIDRLHSEVRLSEDRAIELQRVLDLKDTILDNAEIFICATDAQGRIILFSPGAERLSDYLSKELIGKDFIDIFVPDERQVNSRTFEMALFVSGKPARVNSRWRMRSGEIRVLETSVAPMLDEEGAVKGIIRFGVDITDKNQMLAAERIMGVIDLSILSNLPAPEMLRIACIQAVSELDLASTYVFAIEDGSANIVAAAGNKGARDFEREMAAHLAHQSDMSSATWVTFSPDGIVEIDPDGDASLSPEARVVMIAPIVIDQHLKGALVTCAIRGGSFSPVVTQGIQMVAERLGVALAYTEIREMLLLQGSALNATASGIVITDSQGTVTWANAAFEEMSGFDIADAVGVNIFAGGRGYSEPAFRDPWELVRKGRKWQGEVLNRTREGREYPESVTISPVLDESGTASHVVIVKGDISEARRFERLKSDFTAMISHELRTPLTKISGYVDLLDRWDELDASSRAKSIAALKQNSSEMQALVDKLLSAVHRRVDQEKIRVRNIDLVRLVREVSTRHFEDSTHSLKLSLPVFPSRIDIDPDQIETVLLNLLENAVKYSPAGSEVEVSLSQDGEWAVIAVSDEGLGIPSNDFESMFDSFVQGDMSSTREVGGLGLGLFIARELTAAHGGRIKAIRNPGKGSTFEIYLPIVRKDT
ncbi:MAG: PAS domain S-box protein [Actinobacteria bacterium]|nr:PAS domain S-box protein [Actinomycetota bacterium]